MPAPTIRNEPCTPSLPRQEDRSGAPENKVPREPGSLPNKFETTQVSKLPAVGINHRSEVPRKEVLYQLALIQPVVTMMVLLGDFLRQICNLQRPGKIATAEPAPATAEPAPVPGALHEEVSKLELKDFLDKAMRPWKSVYPESVQPNQKQLKKALVNALQLQNKMRIGSESLYANRPLVTIDTSTEIEIRIRLAPRKDKSFQLTVTTGDRLNSEKHCAHFTCKSINEVIEKLDPGSTTQESINKSV